VRQKGVKTLVEFLLLIFVQFIVDLLDERETAEDEGIVARAFQTLGTVGERCELLSEDGVEVDVLVEMREECEQRKPLFVVGGADGNGEEI